MKLMYICGMYVPSHGGAEVSIYSLLKRLKEDCHWDVLVVTDERYESTRNNTHFNKVPIKTISHSERLKKIESEIKEYGPDVILTQLMWSDVALKLARKYLIPSIMRVCKVPLELDLSKKSEIAPTKIISTSNSVKDYVMNNWGRDSKIIKPLVELKDYIIDENNFNSFNNQLIFMFNPLKRKGGLIFKEIANRLPEIRFGTVFGWSSLKENKDSENFSSEYIKRITESEGSRFDGLLPNYINFDECKNVKVFEPEDDSRELYKKVKILLIPSQWKEAFGRVAIEAMINGIPVIASNVAGLKDAVGSGGILLEKEDINFWISEIKKLSEDESYYKMWAEKGKEFVKKSYSEEDIINQVKQLIEETTKQHNL